MSQNMIGKSTSSKTQRNPWGRKSGNSQSVDISYAANASGGGGGSLFSAIGNVIEKASQKAPTYGEALDTETPQAPIKSSGVTPDNSASGGYANGTVLTGDLDTYETYLQNAQNSYKDIYTENTNFYDQQNKETIAAIEEQKKADLTYADNRYQILLDSINQAKESGSKLAKEQYDLLMNMTEEQRQTVYKAAEEQRAEEYRLAEIERERGVVDARTSYAQNMATYGANAERMDRMGLAGSGYSDYVNAQAYATQRAETQAANAQSEKAKREARYAENQAKLDADLSYNENQYNAQSQYNRDIYDVESTYAEGLRDANLQKGSMVHEAEGAARSDTLAANQAAATGKHEASMSYKENLLAIEGEAAKYRQGKEDTAAAKAEQEERDAMEKEEAMETERKNAYLNLFDFAKSGNYSADEIDALAKEYGLTTEQINSLKDVAENAKEDVLEGETKTEKEALIATSTENYQTIIANIKTDPYYYTDADLDKMVADKLLTGDDAELAKQRIKDAKAQQAKDDIDYCISSGDLNSLQTYLEKAYNGGNGIIDHDTYQDAYFRGALQNCASASGASEVLQVEADLKNLKDAGKISSVDYENAVKYLYSCAGSAMPNAGKSKSYREVDVTLGSGKYRILADVNGTYGTLVDEDTAKVLNGVCGSSSCSSGTVVKLGDTFYVYRIGLKNGEGWVKVIRTPDGFDEKWNAEINRRAKPTVPKHTTSSSN